MSKNGKVFVSLVLVVFLALAATNIEAKRFLGYGGLHNGDHSLVCDKANPSTCKKQEANPYHRGCEAAERCHEKAR